MLTPVTSKLKVAQAPRAIAFLKNALPGLLETIHLPRQFFGPPGVLLAADATGPEAINAVLLAPSTPRADGGRARAVLSKESLGGSGDILLVQL